MSYIPTAMEVAAGRMVGAALPTHSTPSRLERIYGFESAQAQLARLSVDAIFNVRGGIEPNPNIYVPLGIYATRDALSSLSRTDRVDIVTAGRVADELQILCNYLKSKLDLKIISSEGLGLVAELGVASMLWTGIAEGELGLNYAVLMGVHGEDKNKSGLKKDVDLVVKSGESGSQSRKKIQIKAAWWRNQHIYDEDITVIAAQELLETPTPFEAVSKLLRWSRSDPDLRNRVYRKFERKIAGSRRSHKR